MLTKHFSVGGTAFVLSNDETGKVICAATLADDEPEGLFIACMEQYLSLRRAHAAASASVNGQPLPVVLPLRRRQSPRAASQY
jgi:hypothetical protein